MAEQIKTETKPGTGSVSARLDRMMLVLEGNERGAWVIPMLPIYLPHTGISCNLVQVMDNVPSAAGFKRTRKPSGTSSV